MQYGSSKFGWFINIRYLKGIIADEYGSPLTPLYFERYQFEIIIEALKEQNLEFEILNKMFSIDKSLLKLDIQIHISSKKN